MAYRIINNKKYGTVSLLFTSNDSVTIVGNSSSSNVAISDENLAGGSITQIWCGSANSGYWTIKRGSNTVFVATESSSYTDFRGNGVALNIDSTGTLEANLTGTVGTLIIEVKKIPAANGFPTL